MHHQIAKSKVNVKKLMESGKIIIYLTQDSCFMSLSRLMYRYPCKHTEIGYWHDHFEVYIDAQYADTPLSITSKVSIMKSNLLEV